MQLNRESTDYLDWFLAVIVPMVRRRIEEGATKYGELLPPEHDERDFGAEALEELVDEVLIMVDKMRLRHLRWEYDAVRGAINALDREYEAGGVDTLDYRAQREILVTRMWECFYSMQDEYDNQRKERVKNAT